MLCPFVLYVSVLISSLFLEIGDGWHPAFAENEFQFEFFHAEQRFLSDKWEYWYKGYDVDDDNFKIAGQSQLSDAVYWY